LAIELTARQSEIVRLVETHAPITGEQLAGMLGVSRPTLRSDLALLVMLGLIDAKPKVGYFPGPARTVRSAARGLSGYKVKDIQSVAVSVCEQSSVHDAVVALFTENVEELIVVDREQCFTGIVTAKDLLKVTVGGAGASALPVSLVMTRVPNVVTVSPEDDAAEALRLMFAHDLDCLPVVRERDGGPEATGRVTIRHMAELLSGRLQQPAPHEGGRSW
jgi:CBS domain-containing protein